MFDNYLKSILQPSTVRVRSLLAREKPGSGTKSLIVISSPSSNKHSTIEEPEKYDIEIYIGNYSCESPSREEDPETKDPKFKCTLSNVNAVVGFQFY